jgi:type II secretory pathway predicted ATPase ExeA
MDNSFYNFAVSPFENNLDQRFLFLSDDHQEVLAALLYFTQTSKGLAIVCGDVGVGKTMLINALLYRLPETVKPIIIPNPHVSFPDLLSYLAKMLEIKKPGENIQQMMEEIKKALIALKAQDKHVVVIQDEAHLLSDQALTDMRLLSNLETPDQKLLSIVLVGQYALSHKLDRTEMQPLRLRINVNRFLSPFNPAETIQYVDHRLQQAGSSFAAVFADNCRAPIFKMTRGVPRLINQLCASALQLARQEGRPRVNRRTLKRAAAALLSDGIITPHSSLNETGSRSGGYPSILFPVGVVLALGLIIIIAVIMWGKSQPIAPLGKSAGQTLPAAKPRPHPTALSEVRAPSPGKALVTPEAAKLSENSPNPGPHQDRGKGQPIITPPAPGPQITHAPPPGTPVPTEPEGLKTAAKPEEIPPAGTNPQNKAEADVKEPAPASPGFEQVVTQKGETLIKIASQHYPQDPRFGQVAIILQNPQIRKENTVQVGEVLYLPKINFDNHTIQLRDNLWYALYGYFNSPERSQKIVSWFTIKKINFIVKEVRNWRGNTIRRIYIGGYPDEAELIKVVKSVTKKKK